MSMMINSRIGAAKRQSPKFVDLEYPFRRNNLRFDRIEQHENESWEDCQNKIYDLLENKLEMSSIVYEFIRTISRQFFFLTKKS